MCLFFVYISLLALKSSGVNVILFWDDDSYAGQVHYLAKSFGLIGTSSGKVWIGLTDIFDDYNPGVDINSRTGYNEWPGLIGFGIPESSSPARTDLLLSWKNSTCNGNNINIACDPYFNLWDNGDQIPDYWAIIAYEAIYSISKAIQTNVYNNNNVYNGNNIRKELLNLNIDGQVGILKFDSITQDRICEYDTVQIINNKLVHIQMFNPFNNTLTSYINYVW